jgi:hypothetical protein
MTPQEIRRLKPGSWLTFTPTIWSQHSIDGQVQSITPEGHLSILWDDDHRAFVKPEQLHSSKFAPKVPE